MKLLSVAVVALCASAAFAQEPKGEKLTPLVFKMEGLDGKQVDLADFKGKVVLFVNVASKCGYTKQYTGLQALYEKYKKEGLVIVGVPANNFGGQEPGSNQQIAEFCSSKYMVTFPMLGKVSVKGDDMTPLYAFLTGKTTNPKFAGEVAWNFEKFLVGRDGTVIGRYKSAINPDAAELTGAVEAALKAK